MKSNDLYFKWKFVFIGLIIYGCLIKFYDIDSPFRRKDHYNWGNVQHTRQAKCLLASPISESKGIPHYSCKDNKAADFYPNHPPTTIWAAAGWMSLLGTQAEWSIRLLFIIFSIGNIFLVFVISKYFGAHPLLPWAASAMQAIFPFGMYYGSHFDYMSEMSTFAVLIAAWSALRGDFFKSHVLTFFSGLISWAGFLGFASLGFSSLLDFKKNKWKLLFTIVITMISALIALQLMVYLQQGYSIKSFLEEKMIHPGYGPKETSNFLYPFVWFARWIQTHARFLSALLASFMVLELIYRFIIYRPLPWKKRFESFRPWFYICAPGLLFVILGHEFVYLHSFQYGYLVPTYSILVASFIIRLIDQESLIVPLSKKWIWIVPFFFTVLYPYGVYKNIIWLDSFDSVAYLGLVLFFFVQFYKQLLSQKKLIFILISITLVNSFQMINWRSEPTLDADFCAKAKLEYAKTGQPVKTNLDYFYTQTFYCGDIPLIYDPNYKE